MIKTIQPLNAGYYLISKDTLFLVLTDLDELANVISYSHSNC